MGAETYDVDLRHGGRKIAENLRESKGPSIDFLPNLKGRVAVSFTEPASPPLVRPAARWGLITAGRALKGKPGVGFSLPSRAVNSLKARGAQGGEFSRVKP
jgi:hypothetical protein